jgi:hypothetical protein
VGRSVGIMAMTDVSSVALWTVAPGSEHPGLYAPSGEWCGRAAFGGDSMLIASPLSMVRHAQCERTADAHGGRLGCSGPRNCPKNARWEAAFPQDQRGRSSPNQVVSVTGPLRALSIAP